MGHVTHVDDVFHIDLGNYSVHIIVVYSRNSLGNISRSELNGNDVLK
jgi:hypothetical protein